MDDLILTLLLLLGLYLPSSSGGVSSAFFYWLSRLLSSLLLSCLVWRYGTRPGAVTFVSLPITILLSICTLLSWPFRFQGSIFSGFLLLGFILALDLRKVRPGRFAYKSLVAVNFVNIFLGFTILAGSSGLGRFLSTWYSEFYPELVPAMLELRKPVLTFANHSVAGFYLYIMLWLNWENYKKTLSKLVLFFVLAELVLLIALTSFTSTFFAVVTVTQIGIWLWKENRRAFGFAAVTLLFVSIAAVRLSNVYGDVVEELKVAWAVKMNSEISGPLARYGEEGNVARKIMPYLRGNLPIGFGPPVTTDVIDSGILEYVLRGSAILLIVVYVGLYKCVRHNVSLRVPGLALFLAIVAFESGFALMTYYRTAFLLPCVLVWLNHFCGLREGQNSPLLMKESQAI